MAALFDWLKDPILNAPPRGILPDYAFRYMTSDGLLATINSTTLRMNAWPKMNDPREAKDWESTGTLKTADGYTQADMDKRLNDVLRRSARLLALTADREPSPGAEPASLFHRGWGRASLWAHYADDHRGVCLVLDPAAVNEALDGLPPKADRLRFWGGIEYLDKPIRIPLTGTVTDQPPWTKQSKITSTPKGTTAVPT